MAGETAHNEKECNRDRYLCRRCQPYSMQFRNENDGRKRGTLKAAPNI